jgi:hypothetical protein
MSADHHPDEEPAAAEGASPPRAGRNVRRSLLLMMLGGALGLVATLVALRIVNRDPTPSLTPEAFRAARERWRRNEPANYDIEIRVTGTQPATYRAQVRDGQPQSAWRNGKPLTSRRTFGTWSVPGMFSTMSRDVQNLEGSGPAGARQRELVLRAAFDPEYGYPRRYSRIEWGSRRGATSHEVTWEVTEFEIAVP